MSAVNEARDALRDGSPAEAVRLLQAYLREHPEDTAALQVLAQACGRAGDWLLAEETARRLAELEPEDARHWYVLGVALRKQRRYAEARVAQARALRLKPGFGDAMMEMMKIRRGEARSPETARAREAEQPETGAMLPPVEGTPNGGPAEGKQAGTRVPGTEMGSPIPFPDEEGWTCSDCGTANYPNSLQCHVCHTDRLGSAAARARNLRNLVLLLAVVALGAGFYFGPGRWGQAPVGRGSTGLGWQPDERTGRQQQTRERQSGIPSPSAHPPTRRGPVTPRPSASTPSVSPAHPSQATPRTAPDPEVACERVARALLDDLKRGDSGYRHIHPSHHIYLQNMVHSMVMFPQPVDLADYKILSRFAYMRGPNDGDGRVEFRAKMYTKGGFEVHKRGSVLLKPYNGQWMVMFWRFG